MATILKKTGAHIWVFVFLFGLISIAADLYYYNRIAQKDTPDRSQICYSDFRVFWRASYDLRHHILKEWDRRTSIHTFRPIWFLSPSLRKIVVPLAKPGQYIVYKKDEEFYHYRYSPFVAFIMVPLGKIFNQGHALLIWYAILNICLLFAILLSTRQIQRDFGLLHIQRLLILWVTFFVGLRFYLVNIALGQTDIIVTLLFVIFMTSYIRRKDMLSGIALGLIFQFKPFFLPMLVYFLFVRRFKIVLAAGAAFIFFMLAPSCMLGIKKTLSLCRDWWDILHISIPSQILNKKNHSAIYATANTILKIRKAEGISSFTQNLFFSLSAFLTLAAYALIAWLKKMTAKEDEKRFAYLEVSLLIIVSLLFSPILWVSHFINLVIPFSVALAFAIDSKKRKGVYAALGIFVVLSCIAGTDVTKFLPGINDLKVLNTVGVLFLAFAVIHAYRQKRASRFPN